jgi:ACDE family multidrug resistance protein
MSSFQDTAGSTFAEVLPSNPDRTTLTLLLLASMLGPMAGATIVPVLEVIRSDLGVSGMAAGLIITAHGLAIGLSSPLAGWMVDRWGVRLPMACGLLLYGLAGGAGILITSYPLLIASRVAFGLGASLMFAATTVAMLTLYQGSVRDRVIGWRTSATSLGGPMFALLGGALATFFSWHSVFAVYLVGMPIALAVMAVMPETRPAPGGHKAVGSSLELMRHPALIGIYAFVLVLWIMMYGVVVFLPQRLGELGVQEPLRVSMYMAVMGGSAILIGLVYPWLRAHASYLALLRFSTLMLGTAFLILGTAEQPMVLGAATVFLGFGNGVVFSALSIIIAELVPESLLGRATAVSSTATFLGQFISPLVLGPVMTSTSIATGYLVLAGTAALILLALVAMRPSRPIPLKPALSAARR